MAKSKKFHDIPDICLRKFKEKMRYFADLSKQDDYVCSDEDNRVFEMCTMQYNIFVSLMNGPFYEMQYLVACRGFIISGK